MQFRPHARRVVQVVAAATLAGVLVTDVVGRAVFAGEHYAGPAPLLLAAEGRGSDTGGLVPVADLNPDGDGIVSSRDLRPAVLMLVPRECTCGQRLVDVASETEGSKVRLYVIGSNGQRQLSGLRGGGARDAVPLLDRGFVLMDRYQPGKHGTLLLIRADGVIAEIVDDVPLDIDLADRLPKLLEVG